MTPDIDHVVIECRALDGDLYYAEHYGLTLKQAAELIRSGQVERVTAVYSFNPHPSEGWARDVSSDVALEVAALARDEGLLSRTGLEFIDLCDTEVGNTVRWAA